MGIDTIKSLYTERLTRSSLFSQHEGGKMWERDTGILGFIRSAVHNPTCHIGCKQQLIKKLNMHRAFNRTLQLWNFGTACASREAYYMKKQNFFTAKFITKKLPHLSAI